MGVQVQNGGGLLEQHGVVDRGMRISGDGVHGLRFGVGVGGAIEWRWRSSSAFC